MQWEMDDDKAVGINGIFKEVMMVEESLIT